MREILGDEIDLFRPLHLEQLRLANDIALAEGAMFPAHQGNRAECTAVIASFADLEISHVRQIARVNADARMSCDGIASNDSALVKLLREPSTFRRAEEEVDFGQRFDQLILVALDHAST